MRSSDWVPLGAITERYRLITHQGGICFVMLERTDCFVRGSGQRFAFQALHFQRNAKPYLHINMSVADRCTRWATIESCRLSDKARRPSTPGVDLFSQALTSTNTGCKLHVGWCTAGSKVPVLNGSSLFPHPIRPSGNTSTGTPWASRLLTAVAKLFTRGRRFRYTPIMPCDRAIYPRTVHCRMSIFLQPMCLSTRL